MDLKQLLANHHPIVRFDQNDNEKMLELYQQVDMKTKGIQIAYERGPNFFSFLEYHRGEAFVFGAYDGNNIAGMATLIIKDAYINGKIAKIGYFGDLRIADRNKVWAAHWRKLLADIIHHGKDIAEFKSCDFYYFAVLTDNKKAIDSIENQKDETICNQEFARFKMYNLIGAKPFGLYYNDGFHFVLESNDLTLQKEKSQKSFLGSAQNESKVMALKDNEGTTVATFSLWSPSPKKKVILSRLPYGLKIMFRILGVFFNMPKEKEEIKILYLKNLSFINNLSSEEKLKISHAILSWCFSSGAMNHWNSLAVTDLEEECIAFIANKYFFNQNKEIALYHSKRSEDDVLGGLDSIAFDISLV